MKPRIAEDARGFWGAVTALNVSGVVPPGGGVYYPVLRIVCGGSFILDNEDSPKAVTGFGLSYRDPKVSEMDELEEAVEKDQVEVVIMTRPGYESGYSHQKVKMVLHSPSGNSFK